MLEKIIKDAEMTMQNYVYTLLQQEIHQLHASAEHEKEKKRMTRAFIQDGGSLTGEDGLQRLREREMQAEPSSSSRPQQPARCSSYNQEGHNGLKCPNR